MKQRSNLLSFILRRCIKTSKSFEMLWSSSVLVILSINRGVCLLDPRFYQTEPVRALVYPFIFLELYHYFLVNFCRFFLSQKLWKRVKSRFYLNIFINLVIKFFWSLHYLLCSCTNPIFGERKLFWSIAQNANSQSDCSVFKSTISQEKIYEMAWFFSC